MTFNISYNKRAFLKTPHGFNGDRHELWKGRIRIFIQCINFELWETIINGQFIPAHHVNDKVIDKTDFLWTKEDKRNFELDFKAKIFFGHVFKWK